MGDQGKLPSLQGAQPANEVLPASVGTIQGAGSSLLLRQFTPLYTTLGIRKFFLQLATSSSYTFYSNAQSLSSGRSMQALERFNECIVSARDDMTIVLSSLLD